MSVSDRSAEPTVSPGTKRTVSETCRAVNQYPQRVRPGCKLLFRLYGHLGSIISQPAIALKDAQDEGLVSITKKCGMIWRAYKSCVYITIVNSYDGYRRTRRKPPYARDRLHACFPCCAHFLHNALHRPPSCVLPANQVFNPNTAAVTSPSKSLCINHTFIPSSTPYESPQLLPSISLSTLAQTKLLANPDYL
jgi:hypothetical protein